jgi:hypothetical protein
MDGMERGTTQGIGMQWDGDRIKTETRIEADAARD